MQVLYWLKKLVLDPAFWLLLGRLVRRDSTDGKPSVDVGSLSVNPESSEVFSAGNLPADGKKISVSRPSRVVSPKKGA